MLPDLRRLPMRVRPASFEPRDTYIDRLREAQGYPLRTWGYFFRPLVRAATGTSEAATDGVVEALAGLDEGHFQRDRDRLPRHADGTECARCATGLNERFACTRCSGGLEVKQQAHDGPRVCRRHRTWVGPRADAESQFTVDDEIVRADRLYRRMKREGVIDAHRLAELESCVDAWAQAHAGRDQDAPATFRIAVELGNKIFRHRFLALIADHTMSSGDRYATLHKVVSGCMADADVSVLVDALWTLLRAARHAEVEDPHAIAIPRSRANDGGPEDLEPMQTSFWPRQRHLHLIQYVTSKAPATRFDRVDPPSAANHYACVRGHRFNSSPKALGRSPRGTGCGVCANKVALSGFNTLADTHPELAAQWHPEANGDLTPNDVVAGSPRKVAWLCEASHTSYVVINVRANRGIGCAYCSNYLLDRATNALTVTHPDVAAYWHPELNGVLTPADVVAGTDRVVWWICDAGIHSYQLQVGRRVRGRKCAQCKSARTKARSLALTHPHVAERWHPTKNDTLTPEEVTAGSGRMVWWLCDREDHAYYGEVQGRVLGRGCSICSGRQTASENCMSATHPHLALEFHPDRNGADTPDTIKANVSRKLWWRCQAHGHEWQARGGLRANKGYGCPYCSGRQAWSGWNDLATTHPDLAAEWASDLNGDLKPTEIMAGTKRRIWWRCQTEGHVWIATGNNRRSGQGCPTCHRRGQRGRS